MCFLPTVTLRPIVLAVLHKDHHQTMIITSHDINISSQDISSSSPYLDEIRLTTPSATSIVPVPAFINNKWNLEGGLMVFSDGQISFYGLDKKKKKRKDPDSIISKAEIVRVAWLNSGISMCHPVSTDGLRFILGDDIGQLAILSFNSDVPQAEVLPIGQVSPPTTLALLPNQHVYIGSHFGDSQLLRILPDQSSCNGTFLEVIETYKNIAPITDAFMGDFEGTGQQAIVTCSGSNGSGSLRFVQTGTNFKKDARVEDLIGVSDMWPLKKRFCDEFHQYLLTTTHTSSQCIKFPDLGCEGDYTMNHAAVSFTTGLPTISAANVMKRVAENEKSSYEDSAYVVQVTPKMVKLLDMCLEDQEDVWEPEANRRILLADISPSQVCLALSGGMVVLLQVLGNSFKLQKSYEMISVPNSRGIEISSLSLSQSHAGLPYSTHLVVGYWSTHDVSLYSLPHLNLVATVKLSHLPRSTLLYDIGDKYSRNTKFLFVGMSNGSVAYGSVMKGNIGNMKVVTLGDSPVSLLACEAPGTTVLAIGSRSVILTMNEDAISHSPLLLKGVNSARPLHISTFPRSLILNLDGGTIIGRIQELDKVQIRKVSLNCDGPYKIAYLDDTKVFGVGCIREDRNLSGKTKSVFKIVDSIGMETRQEFHLDVNEEVTAVASVEIETLGATESYFALGTVFMDDIETEPTRGRLLLYSFKNTFFQQCCALEASGSVYAVTSLQGKLLAAINTSIVLYSLDLTENGATGLIRIAEWNHNYLITNIAVRGEYIVVGDAVASLAVLRISDRSLVTVTRDYSPLWPLCVDIVDEQSIIGANCDNNLFSFKITNQGEVKILEQNGFYYFGETINKIIPGNWAISETKLGVGSTSLLFTSTGRISIAVELGEDLSHLLVGLERNMAGVLRGPGNIEHTKWRTPMSVRGRSDIHNGATGFLDGDFLEKFLEFSESSHEVKEFLEGKNEAEMLEVGYAHIRSTLEALRSAH